MSVFPKPFINISLAFNTVYLISQVSFCFETSWGKKHHLKKQKHFSCLYDHGSKKIHISFINTPSKH